jgi:UDP-N-acetylmuramoyl-L-alanyl-D-glutamate--2,6-diaminopimelate ligase
METSMKLMHLLKPWLHREVADCVIHGLRNDSRLVQPGDLFIAYPGALADGRLFINQAVSAGAVAVVYDPHQLPSSCHLPEHIPCIPVAHLADHLADIANRFYDKPSTHLAVTGVTGTNGKTTIAYQLAQAHALLGQRSAYIGTIGQGEVQQLKPMNNTTPDGLFLHQLMHQYQQQHIQQVCMEVSSHALSQHRINGIQLKQAIYTNLTLDHLDYHHSMEAYAQAKALLFALDSLEYAIINQDDPYQHLMEQALNPHVKKISYGLHQSADVHAVEWRSDSYGTTMEVHSPWGTHQLKIQASGRFNIYNCLAIFSSLMASGYSAEQVIPIMEQLKAAPGRMELVARSPDVFVDYAHTPDALENVLITLNQLKKGRLWVVFGCGGDRDKTKRPIMGKTASLHADKIIVTSDNPRHEDPALIIDDIMSGIEHSENVMRYVTREEAIAYALNEAAAEDIILIAGKGHEEYQQIGATKHAFSDQEVVKQVLSSRSCDSL